MNSPFGRAICFIGTDGTGKTTFAKILRERLRVLDIDCVYKHHTNIIIDAIPFWLRKYVRKYLSSNITNSQEISSGKKRLEFKILLFLFSLSLVSFLNGLAWYVKNIPSLLCNDVVIFDRYAYDLIIDFINAYPFYLIKLYLKFIPRPNLVLLLDVPPAIAFERRREASLKFYTRQRSGYLNIIKESGFGHVVVIDTSFSIEKTQKLIFDHVLKFLDATELMEKKEC